MVKINTILINKYIGGISTSCSPKGEHSCYVFNTVLNYKTIKTKKRMAFYITDEFIDEVNAVDYDDVSGRWPFVSFHHCVFGPNSNYYAWSVTLFQFFKIK